MSVETFVPEQAIKLTKNGSQKIKSLLGDSNKKHLRVFIHGGGCSGFQYGFDIEENINDDDVIIEVDGARVAIDTLSYQYLVNSEIDYKEELLGSMFVVLNPQAKSTCGCGSSFTI